MMQATKRCEKWAVQPQARSGSTARLRLKATPRGSFRRYDPTPRTPLKVRTPRRKPIPPLVHGNPSPKEAKSLIPIT
jgi:hypothetical protein